MFDPSMLLAVAPAFVSALNPFGDIARGIGEIMACRVAIKRLRNEAKQIEYDYYSDKNRVDATLKVALRTLENRRVAMERFFDNAEIRMRQHHIWGNQRVKVIVAMTGLISQRDMSLQEKQLAHETIRALSTDLVESQRHGTAALSVLMETARQQLMSVPSFRGMLNSGDN